MSGYISNFLITHTPFRFSIGLRKYMLTAAFKRLRRPLLNFYYIVLHVSILNATDTFQRAYWRGLKVVALRYIIRITS